MLAGCNWIEHDTHVTRLSTLSDDTMSELTGSTNLSVIMSEIDITGHLFEVGILLATCRISIQQPHSVICLSSVCRCYARVDNTTTISNIKSLPQCTSKHAAFCTHCHICIDDPPYPQTVGSVAPGVAVLPSTPSVALVRLCYQAALRCNSANVCIELKVEIISSTVDAPWCALHLWAQ